VTAIWIIRLCQISTGNEADRMLFRGAEADARAHALNGIADNADLEIASIRARESEGSVVADMHRVYIGYAQKGRTLLR
jgi:hypothetical protein